MDYKGTIIYVGAFRFPDQDAAAKRVLAIGYVLREIGYKVIFAGGEQGTPNTVKYHCGFEYYSQSELDKGDRSIAKKVKGYLKGGQNTVNWMLKFMISTKIDTIICYNSSYIFQRRMVGFCKRNGIKVVGDCTEWYDSRHLPGGKWGIISIDNFIKMYYGFPRIHNLIVISSYLANFYRNKNANLLLVPPLLVSGNCQVQSVSAANSMFAPRRIIYAGNPGMKDNLIDIIKIIGSEEFLNSLHLTIIGVTSESFLKQYNIEVPDNVSFLGRVSSDIVKRQYASSDFSIIYRPNKRYANAGFPTKFVESMGNGVPVITTNTSDLDKYLSDGVNGFWFNDNNQNDLFTVFRRISSISDEQLGQMKTDAFLTSSKFDIDNYKAPLAFFIKRLD